MKTRITTIAYLAACAIATPAAAAMLTPISYSMLNGHNGITISPSATIAFEYLDDTYGGPSASGNPKIEGAPLSGGLGDLTDGVIASNHWYEPPTKRENGKGLPGPYVAWYEGKNRNVTIDFYFGEKVAIDRVIFHGDDVASNASGADQAWGGVSQPDGVSFGLKGDATARIDITNADTNDSVYHYNLATNGIEGQAFSLTLFRDDDPWLADNRWIFLSEVQFEGHPAASPVPLPAALPLLLTGIAGLGALGVRRRVA